MAIVPLLFSQLSSLLLIAIIGYAAVKKGIMKASECKPISTLLIYVIIPSSIIKALQLPLSEEKIHGFGIAVIFAIAVHLFWLVLTTFLGKATSLDGTARASLMYTNSGNLIFPLVASVFGEEYVFYACMYNAVQQFFVWTHGMALMSGKRRITLRQVLLNINILSVAIGMTLFFFQIILPPIIQNTMGMLAGMIGPLSMLVTGMVMAEKDLSGLFHSTKVWLICIGRLFVFPFFVTLLVMATGFLKTHPGELFLFQIGMLAVCAPPATLLTQFAVMFRKDAFLAGSVNLISMVLCVITMPLLIALFTYLAG